MASPALQLLASISWVTTLAVLLVALARSPLRSLLGARAAYWLWLAIPASALTAALPHPGEPAGERTSGAPALLAWLWTRAHALTASIHVSGRLSAAVLLVWVAGALAALGCMVLRQRAFVRSLGRLDQAPDGTWRSHGTREPMLVGALRPKVLVPLDFEQRFTVDERELVLAHERAHMRRGDAVVNALGAGWLCVFWFNPVMFSAMRLLRFDQDLACDATVLSEADRSLRGRYAGALLKVQLAGEAVLPLPLACHWRSTHPLRRRIAALRGPVAGRMRNSIGTLFVSIIVICTGAGARAVQPSFESAPPAAPHSIAAREATAPIHSSGKICPLSRRRAPTRAAQRR